jgi:hypothetical protein
MMASTLSTKATERARHKHLRLVESANIFIREEIVPSRFALRWIAPGASRWDGSLLMLALLESEGYALGHISTVWVAALQRLADDQARLLFGPLSTEPEQAGDSVLEYMLSTTAVLLQSQAEATSAAALAIRERNETLRDMAVFARNCVDKIGLPDC